MHKQSIFSTLLKEPLIHFLLIGAGLFFIFSQLNGDEDLNNTQQIIIDKSQLTLLLDNFMKENNRKPSHEEQQTLLSNDIKEEILYREALAMGLDKHDKVIRHRLAQKMKHIFEDMSISDDLSNENEDFYKTLKIRYSIIINEDLKKEFNLSFPK